MPAIEVEAKRIIWRTLGFSGDHTNEACGGRLSVYVAAGRATGDCAGCGGQPPMLENSSAGTVARACPPETRTHPYLPEGSDGELWALSRALISVA